MPQLLGASCRDQADAVVGLGVLDLAAAPGKEIELDGRQEYPRGPKGARQPGDGVESVLGCVRELVYPVVQVSESSGKPCPRGRVNSLAGGFVRGGGAITA